MYIPFPIAPVCFEPDRLEQVHKNPPPALVMLENRTDVCTCT